MNIAQIIESKDMSAIAEILAANPSLVNDSEEICYAPLIYAVRDAKSEQIVRYLLAHGAETHGTGALHQALYGGNLEIASALLDFGADINEVCPSEQHCEGGYTPLMSAIRGGHLDAFLYAIDHGAEISKMSKRHWEWHRNGWNGDEEVSPLHMAIINQNLDMVEWLLSLGADIRQRAYEHQVDHYDYCGHEGTAVHFAAGYGTREICKLIMDGLPDEEVISKDNYDYATPKVWACRRDNFAGLIYLLRRGDTSMYHCEHPYGDFVEYLITRYSEANGTLSEEEQRFVSDLLREDY